jgi:O-antigen/teichoic acid export membrane protein
MGVVIACRWPVSLYMGGMLGLERHVFLNALQIALSVLATGGAIAVLWIVSASVEAFFYWQLFVAILRTTCFAIVLWYLIPAGRVSAAPSYQTLKKIVPFATGVAGAEVLGVLLLQMDKIVLSTMLSIEKFGYYVLASTIANALTTLVSPIQKTVFPRFSAMVSRNEPKIHIAKLYHLVCQANSVLLMPLALTLAFFSYEVLLIYTGDANVANQTAVVLSILIFAKMLHGCMLVPYAMQLAHGWTKLAFYQNLVSVILFIPIMFVLVQAFGKEGAAVAWLLVTIGYVFIGIPLMHRKILQREMKAFYINDIGIVFMMCIVGVAMGRFLFDWDGVSLWIQLVGMGGIMSLASLLSAIGADRVRERSKRILSGRFA